MILRQMKTMTASILVAGALFAPAASGEEIYATDDPFGGIFGVWGYDVHDEQSVAVQFTPEADFHLDHVSLWLWNNDSSGEATPIRISLQVADGSFERSTGVSFGVMPGNEVLEEWTMNVPYTGLWSPLLFEFPSSIRPRIEAGMSYWVVATSPAEAPRDPVWAVAQPGLGFGTTGDPRTGEWYPGREGSVGAMVVEGTPATDTALGQRVCGASPAPQCGEDEFCRYSAGECGADDSRGLCTPFPEACPMNWDPVCGCDGHTYSNECVADTEGVSIDYWGTCDRLLGESYPVMEGSVGAVVVEGSPAADTTQGRPVTDSALGQRACSATSTTQCGEDEFCKYAAGECGADDSPGLCTPYPDACPLGVGDPACGCNGRTYGNECEAEIDGVSIDHWGVCD